MSNDKINFHLGFKNGKLVTVIYTLENNVEDAIDCDY